jgi:hypothetical protein
MLLSVNKLVQAICFTEKNRLFLQAFKLFQPKFELDETQKKQGFLLAAFDKLNGTMLFVICS